MNFYKKNIKILILLQLGYSKRLVVMLNEISQEKNKYQNISFISGLQRNDMNYIK